MKATVSQFNCFVSTVSLKRRFDSFGAIFLMILFSFDRYRFLKGNIFNA